MAKQTVPPLPLAKGWPRRALRANICETLPYLSLV